MKRISFLLLAGALIAPGALVVAPHDAGAQARTNYGPVRKKGNWSVSRRRQPVRTAPPRGRFDFFGVFAPDAARDVARRGDRPFADPRRIVSLPPEKPKFYTYVAPRTVALSARDLGPAPADPAAARIHAVLRDGLAAFPVTPEHRKAIVAFYKARGFAPVWTSASAVKERAFPVLELLARADEVALDPALYRLPVVWEANGDLAAFQGDAGRLARLDVELTAAALRYARHASGGQVDPNRLSAYHDLKPPRVSAATALKNLAESGDPAAWLDGLHPRHRAWRALKAELARLQRRAVGEKPLPPLVKGPVIRPGQFDERIPLIRRYLKKAGFIRAAAAPRGAAVEVSPARAEETSAAVVTASREASAAPAPTAGDDNRLIYDDGLVRAVRAFQRKHGLKPDGIIGNRTIARLNALRNRGPAARIRKLRLNMERLRWMPRDFGREYFFVNQPAFEVYLVRDGRTIWSSRVIVGKPTNQTAFFSDMMEYVEFNPYWGVPQSIITKEFMPKLLRNPGWLDKEGYEIYDRRGRRLSSWEVPWGEFAGQSKVPFDVRQPPGPKNALGRMKFMFPNHHAIYMHDTPTKHLFKRDRRAFSHGCVRVQKPWELARIVTGLSDEEIRAHVNNGRNHKLTLPRKIPVHLAYFTAWPDDSGRIRYYADVYGRDKRLARALATVRKALRVPAGGGGATTASIEAGHL